MLNDKSRFLIKYLQRNIYIGLYLKALNFIQRPIGNYKIKWKYTIKNRTIVMERISLSKRSIYCRYVETILKECNRKFK